MSLAELVQTAPDPELARIALDRIREAGATITDADEALVRLLGFSRAAADFFAAHPEELSALGELRARTRAELDAELARDAAERGVAGGLRRFRRRAMFRVAARDLEGAPVDDVVAEITAIADACLEMGCREAADGVRLAVIGLGKLGGSELNYASDVDPIFVHDGDGEAAEKVAARLIALLSEPSGEGIVLRVDTALRPGGRSAALTRSLDSTLAYYEREAATWERQAMIKARAVAGDPWLGSQFVQGVAPSVYPDELEPRAIDEVRRTKVRLEEYIRRRGKELTEVKRGRGGIRDVEFAVQLLQIVHGRRDPLLRERNTLRALEALAEGGYVAERDATSLAGAYRWLRALEHRLQLVRDLQTHDLPDDARARASLARALGLADASSLQVEYDRQTTLVRGIHERLFYRPLLEAFAGPATAAHPGTDRAATEELLAGLGFRSPARSYEVLSRLIDPAQRMGKVLSLTFPLLAPALALAADPDQALVRLERVADAVGDRHGPADTLAGDPGAARRLAHAVAASAFATDLLVADPERIRVLAPAAVHASDAAADLVSVVGRWAARELLPAETGAAITGIADRVVREAVDVAGPSLPFAVIGMGKLGASELNFASDLDLLFVYEGEGSDDLAAACDAAERVMRSIRDDGWEPDADLRPEGKNGPLARSVAGFLEYWERYAETWEFQSLLRARFVAGDRTLGLRFCAAASDLAYPPYLTVDRVAEIRRMRERIERERVKPPEAAKFHFKLGRGSLADVQFAVELSLMRFGGEHEGIRTVRTLDAIEALAEHKLIEQSVARDLGEAFTFLSDVKNALEVDRRIHAEALPASPGEQTALARRLGFEEYPRHTFLDEYRRVTRRCRSAMERLFYEEG